MTTIKDVKLLPDQSPVDSVQGLIKKVFPQETIPTKYGEKSKQTFWLADAAGNEIKCEVWGHSTIDMYEGKEVVIKQGKPGKGLSVKRDSYIPKGSTETVESIRLNLSNASQFQILAGSFPKPPEPEQTTKNSSYSSPALQPESFLRPKSLGLVAGQSVGASLNQAHELMRFLYNPPEIQVLLSNGDYWQKLGIIASSQIKLAGELEHGKVYEAT